MNLSEYICFKSTRRVFLTFAFCVTFVWIFSRLDAFPKNYVFNPCVVLLRENTNERLAKEEAFLNNIADELTTLARQIAKAHDYSKHGKALYELSEAFNMLNNLLDKTKAGKLKETLDNLKSKKEMAIVEANQKIYNDSKNQPEICPEIFMGMMHGYPYYYEGHKTDYVNCTGQKLGEIFTVLINTIHDVDLDNLENLLKPLEKYYPNVSVLVAFSSGNVKRFAPYKNFHPAKFDVGKSAGEVWRSLASLASTKYIFVARQVLRFDNHTSFERFLRFLSYGIADAVGASHRYTDGRWFRGCHATTLRNYTLKFVDGFDLSLKSCIYCDYLTGPFAVKRELFLELADDSLNQETMFVDLFTTMTGKSKIIMSCPDEMLEVIDRELQVLPKSEWLSFVRKWKLYRIVFTNQQELLFTCNESSSLCVKSNGLIMPPCCTQELIAAVRVVSSALVTHNILFDLINNANLGAVRLYGVNPDENRVDFNVDVRERAKISDLYAEFKSYGYTVIEGDIDYKCLSTSENHCGYFAVNTTNWEIKMFAANFSFSNEAYRYGMNNRIVIDFNGIWIASMFNPGASARYQYGDHVFSHFKRWHGCPNASFHGCLNMFLPTGDIQFKDV